MATANLKIDQAGLSAGVAGKARLDGRADGSLVTLTSSTPGTTNSFRLLYVPPDDDEALDSLAAVGGGATPVWTFRPKAGVRGPYRIELTVDAGLAGESKQTRIFGIRTWRHGIVAPALNESGDPAAASDLSGAALATALSNTQRNVDGAGQPSADGWQRSLVEMANALDVGNHAQLVVPAGAVCVVADGQRMFYRGDLVGDFDGDLEEIGPELPTLPVGSVLGKPIADDAGAQPLSGEQLRYLMLKHAPGASSNDIVNESGGGTEEFYSGETWDNWGAGSGSWRSGYVFHLYGDPDGGQPCTLTGFAHDEVSYLGAPAFGYTKPSGPSFCHLKWCYLDVSAPPLVLKNNDPSSDAGNRIYTPDGGDYFVTPGSTFMLVYDGRSDPGHWIIAGPPSSPPWGSPIIEIDSDVTLVKNSVNRFRNDVVQLYLQMPENPSDGTIVRLKEVSGVGGYQVTISGNGKQIERDNGTVGNTWYLLPSRRGVVLEYMFDAEASRWRLLLYFQPLGMA